MLITLFSSCLGENDQEQDNDNINHEIINDSYTTEESKKQTENNFLTESLEYNTETNEDSSDSSETSDSSDSPDTPSIAEVFEQYPNLITIGDFRGGLAPFVINTSTGNTYGYIDIEGNVKIEPLFYDYTSFRKTCVNTPPNFGNSNYVKTQYSSKYCIIDRNGNIVIEHEVDNVSDFGGVYNGYIAVERKFEEFKGNVYTVTIYSATDLHEIATFSSSELSSSYVDNQGYISICTTDDNGNTETVKIFIGDYDPDFTPVESSWNVDIDKIEEFEGVRKYYKVSSSNNSIGQIAAITLKNKDNRLYFATVDQNGNILMAPQNNIIFRCDDYTPIDKFCFDLIPAKDSQSNLWGYIDPYGNWKIPAIYSSAQSFNTDGYATVNNATIIKTNGEVILSAAKSDPEDIIGSYTNNAEYEYARYTATFNENGTLKIANYGIYTIGTYKVENGIVIIDGVGSSFPIVDGIYPLQIQGNRLIINGIPWTRIK